MAEIAEELLTAEQKEERAKDYFNRGSRNYLVKDYSEAAEDLSHACELYAEVYGNESEEIGLPFLYYAKTLIALAQRGENKVLAIDETAAEDDGNEQAAPESSDSDDDDDEEDDKKNEIGPANGENGEGANGSAATGDPQPGTSSGKTNGDSPKEDGAGANNEGGETGDDEDDITNLQCAWESLEMAVKIFGRMGDCALPNLAEAHFELGEISLENSHYAEAIEDYERSAAIRLKLPEDNLRVIAETKYKVGLCHLLIGKFDESVAALKESAEYLDGVICSIKEKDPAASTEATIKELEETKQEIQNKIIEVEETKTQSIEEVKREIARLMNPIPQSSGQGGSSSSGAGGSSSATDDIPEAKKPKATDISHLIKRKKPETPNDVADGPSQAKKPALE